jgi:hypothetical protein
MPGGEGGQRDRPPRGENPVQARPLVLPHGSAVDADCSTRSPERFQRPVRISTVCRGRIPLLEVLLFHTFKPERPPPAARFARRHTLDVVIELGQN